MEEVLNMKKAMKDLFSQLIEDFVDGMNTLKDETLRQHSKTRNALARVEKKIESLNSKSKSLPSSTVTFSASSPMASPPSSSSTSPKTTKSKTSSSTSTATGPSRTSGPSTTTSEQPKKKSRSKRSKYLMKPKVLYIGDSVAHNANFNIVEAETNVRVRTVKAYSSVYDKKAKWPKKNVTDVTPSALMKTWEEDEYTHLVIAAPTVDISNLDTSKLGPLDNIEYFKQEVVMSCKNIFTVAHEALKNKPSLNSVIIMEHAPRFDQKSVDPSP